MVSILNGTQDDELNNGLQPFLVELVGPAGAGKTSLSRALAQCSEEVVEETTLAGRKIANIPFFARNSLLLLPTFFRQYRNGKRFTRDEMIMALHLMGWQHVLKRPAPKRKIVILDHGPVFMLTWLRCFGIDNLRSQSFDKWWEASLKRWSYALDMVIWLDAPNAILFQRIHARDSWHLLKELSEESGDEFLARYRKSYEITLAALMANHRVSLVRFDTDQESPNQITNRVLAEINLGYEQG